MRRRILLLTLSTTFLVVAAFVVPLAILIDRETVQRAGLDLQNQAQETAFAIRGTSDPSQIRTTIARTDAERGTSTQVTIGGTTVGSLPAGVSVSAPRGGGGGGDGMDPDDRPGQPFGGPQSVPGGEVAVGFNRDSGVFVAVFASDDRLRSGATGWFALLGGVTAVLLAVAAVAAVVVSRRISAPLTATAEAAHRLSAGDIDARAPTAGPREVAAVGAALNRLAGRIEELIAEERETVADLSHRMRTPLTALRLDADGLRDPAEAERIGNHAATLERTLTAVIRAARRPEREGLVPACDATAVVGGRTAFWAALAEDQGRAASVTLPERPVTVRAADGDLAAAVDALVENVLAHTPEGTGYRVVLRELPAGGAELLVDDDGPGIPEGATARGRSDRGSTGLGLSIAARCAENSGGSFAVERPDGGGGRVRMTLLAP